MRRKKVCWAPKDYLGSLVTSHVLETMGATPSHGYMISQTLVRRVRTKSTFPVVLTASIQFCDEKQPKVIGSQGDEWSGWRRGVNSWHSYRYLRGLVIQIDPRQGLFVPMECSRWMFNWISRMWTKTDIARARVRRPPRPSITRGARSTSNAQRSNALSSSPPLTRAGLFRLRTHEAFWISLIKNSAGKDLMITCEHAERLRWHETVMRVPYFQDKSHPIEHSAHLHLTTYTVPHTKVLFR